jgi:TatD DNase family protein
VIDTHAHLDALDDPAAALARAAEAGVTRVLTVGTTVEGCRTALELAEEHEGVFAILGLHPHEAGSVDEGAVDEVAELVRHTSAVAVGETGLDYFRDYAPRDRQQWLFECLLGVAADVGKPVVVHTRAAEEDTLATLAKWPGTVVLHCFSSSALLPAGLERSYYVSFAGNVTYPKAGDLRIAATRVPAERILAETDTPYLAPQPVRGRRNEPANVVHTLAALAEARGEEPSGLEAAIEANAAAAFGLPA